MLMTLAKACEIAGHGADKIIDDRTILRREADVDFLCPAENGRIICNRDDVAALILYAEMRRAGQPVKVAGITASRIRDGMRDYPEADQLTIVTFQNGLTTTLPSADLDLSTGYNSGSYLSTALLVDCRNLRARVQSAVDAFEPVIGAEDERD
jgi:hypothetical protein